MNQPLEKLNASMEVQPLSSEVVSLCALLARIMHRCLQERDPRIVSLLSLTIQPQEVSHEQAA